MTFTVPVWLLVALGIVALILIVVAGMAIYLLIGAIARPRW